MLTAYQEDLYGREREGGRGPFLVLLVCSLQRIFEVLRYVRMSALDTETWKLCSFIVVLMSLPIVLPPSFFFQVQEKFHSLIPGAVFDSPYRPV